ncbi:hypothetical protein [Burkholderia sp. WSM2230]|uniref:hypothetical protein n=1 Tax=Burkholderia sp. WSM2230 TaxID=944435 RepID=UPI000470F88E|nr:hypothetical protein [Burkholderia sp. WSM2230]
MHQNQIEKLLEATVGFGKSNGVALSQSLEEKALFLIRWVEFLAVAKKTGCADELLEGVMCAVRETAACIALGLARPALFSLRAQIDLLLTWIYFKDHPIEWRQVNASGEGFKLKTEILKYLTEMYPSFGMRFGILKQVRARREEDPYRLLSAHIHAQTTAVMPNVVNLTDAIAPQKTLEECVEIEFEVCEYLNDVLASAFLEDHHKFPDEIRRGILDRMATAAQKATLFAGV